MNARHDAHSNPVRHSEASPTAALDATTDSPVSEPATAATEPLRASGCHQLTERDQQALADAETQEAYRAEYIRQLKLRSCPGCGEGEQLF